MIFNFDAEKYRVEIQLINGGVPVTGGTPFFYNDAPTAFKKAVMFIRDTLPYADIIEVVATDDGKTIVSCKEDSSLQVLISPNVLARGVKSIPPYSLSLGKSLPDIPES